MYLSVCRSMLTTLSWFPTLPLSSKQVDLLRLICARGSIPRDQLDGRVLRPLLAHQWVTELAGVVRATDAGQAFAARHVGGDSDAAQPTSPGGLSVAQEDFLRYLLRQSGPVLEDHVDGRGVRALLVRGLIRRRDGWITPTEEAAVHLAAHDRRDREAWARRAAQSPQGARAQAVLRAVEQLEKALPSDAEVIVGDQPAYADDVLAGLRRFARGLAAIPRGGESGA